MVKLTTPIEQLINMIDYNLPPTLAIGPGDLSTTFTDSEIKNRRHGFSIKAVGDRVVIDNLDPLSTSGENAFEPINQSKAYRFSFFGGKYIWTITAHDGQLVVTQEH